jgi:hypothetical protein
MKWHSCIVASLLAALVSAQNPAPPGGVKSKPAKKTARADQRARNMRNQITEGRVVKSHVRVRVRLRNGNRLTGVVKDGRLVERVDGLRFVEAQARERGAGIRLWYSGGTRSYIFVPFESLKAYEVVQRLSQKQLQEIEDEMQMAEKRAAERKARAALKANGKAGGDAGKTTGPGNQPGNQPGGNAPPTVEELGSWKPGKPGAQATPVAGAEKAEGAKAETAEVGGDAKPVAGASGQDEKTGKAKVTTEEVQKKLLWSELLRKFPPKMGWNEAKKNEIARRRVVIGANPSKLELEFVENFDDWMTACEQNGIDPNAAVEKKPMSKRERRRAERARTRGRRN